MAILPIITFPDPRLRARTVPVEVVTDDFKAFVSDLRLTMMAMGGVGIAAIQVGRLERIFLLDLEGMPEVFINPTILELGGSLVKVPEGCLSFPGISVDIPRHQQVRVEATSLDGVVFTVDAQGFAAQAIQHEYDHLTGRLMIDLVTGLKKQSIQRKMSRASKG